MFKASETQRCVSRLLMAAVLARALSATSVLLQLLLLFFFMLRTTFKLHGGCKQATPQPPAFHADANVSETACLIARRSETRNKLCFLRITSTIPVLEECTQETSDKFAAKPGIVVA